MLKISRRFVNTSDRIIVSKEVREALRHRQPIVALESTIITHGMPYPKNLEMAQSVEKMILQTGAVPATIAAINGRFHVGLNQEDLIKLSKPSAEQKKYKISRRDFPLVLANNFTGGTTVSGTMILAHSTGIHYFATGGIGGVHRGAETTMDISADLMELGKTPVCVVCAGVKSILDIPKTLEVLETQGVPVAVYCSNSFPSFFTNNSGIPSPNRVDTTRKLAEMYYYSRELSLQNGMMVAVPNPNPADSESINEAINQALEEAKNQGVIGSHITPFLLDKIERITGGKSLDSNLSLVLNNAKIAAQIAVEYSLLCNKIPIFISSLSQQAAQANQTIQANAHKDESVRTNLSEPKFTHDDAVATKLPIYPVLVFGGAVIDTIAKSSSPLIPGSSNPGTVSTSMGGVGRNIAARLSELGKAVSLVSLVGSDDNGNLLIKNTANLGVDTTYMTAYSSSSNSEIKIQSANYLAIHDSHGELFAGIANMNIFEYMDKSFIQSLTGKIRHCSLVVSDANLPPEGFKELMRVCYSYSVPVFFEPTSDPKCILPITTRTIHMIDVIKPNLSELLVLVRLCYDEGAIVENKVPVLRAIESLSDSLTNPKHAVYSYQQRVNDVKTLSCALQYLMKNGIRDHNTGKISGLKSFIPATTAEGKFRPVQGKHVITSMGSHGVVWCGPKSSVLKLRAGQLSTNHVLRNFGESTVDSRTMITIDDDTVVKVFPPISVLRPTDNINEIEFKSRKITNGAGDALCAGVISEMLDGACNELDTDCIVRGMESSVTKIRMSSGLQV